MQIKLNSLLSIAKYASAAVVASSTFLFAPSGASAVTLIRANDGSVTRIENLEVEGLEYNVDFIFNQSYNDVFGGSFDFESEQEALSASEAVATALGDEEFLFEAFLFNAGVTNQDDFFIPFEFSGVSDVRFVGEDVSISAPLLDIDQPSPLRFINVDGDFAFAPWAKFSLVDDGGNGSVSTPEPTLILGFITLGSLMLASKRKTK
ncbi:MAG: PEP-CTERM sorting domain-containing protein [Cyanobacteria bacterium J06592_8]